MLKLPGVTPNYVKEGLVENVCKFCFGTTLERFEKLFEIMCSDSTSVSLQSVEQVSGSFFAFNFLWQVICWGIYPFLQF